MQWRYTWREVASFCGLCALACIGIIGWERGWIASTTELGLLATLAGLAGLAEQLHISAGEEVAP